MQKVRCSKVGLALSCSQSTAEPEIAIDQSSDVARLGTALHQCAELLVDNERPSVDAIAGALGVDRDELSVLVAYLRKAWREVCDWFPEPMTELKVNGVLCQGTADVVSIDSGMHMAVLDWKSGRSGEYHTDQLMAYADCLRNEYAMPSSGYILAVEVHLRDSAYIVHKFSEAQLDLFRDRLAKAIAGTRYSPGRHCGFCPRRSECNAYALWIGESLSLVTEGAKAIVSRETLGSMWDRVSSLKHAIRNYEEAVDSALMEGPLAIDDERELVLEDRSRKEINPRIAWGILKGEFGLDDLALESVLRINKKEMERQIGLRSAPRSKGKDIARAMELLNESDGVSVTTYTAKAVRRKS